MKKRRTSIMLIVLVILIIIQSSCSLFPSTIERHLFFDSICWEDDNHILMYSMVRKWVNTSAISWGSETGRWDWSKGEIWRINVFTGEKELLLRREGDKYTGLSTVVKIDVLGDRKLISLDGNAYIMEGESTDWQEIEGIYEAEWINDNEIIGITEDNSIIQYDLLTEEKSIKYEIDIIPRYFNYFNLYDICIISDLSIFTFYNKMDNRTFQRFETLLTETGDTLGVLGYNNKCFISENNIMNHRINLENRVCFLQIDTNLNVQGIFSLNDIGVMPRNDFKYFLCFTDNSVKLVDENNNEIKTIYFPLDQLDE